MSSRTTWGSITSKAAPCGLDASRRLAAVAFTLLQIERACQPDAPRPTLPVVGDQVVSDGAGSPRLVRVREPDQLGVERAHSQLAFGVRLVELAEPDRHVAADNDRTPACLDDDHLHAACVARRREEPEPRKQLVLTPKPAAIRSARSPPDRL